MSQVPVKSSTVYPNLQSGRKNFNLKEVGDIAKAKGATSGTAATAEKIGGDKLGPKGGASNASRVLYPSAKGTGWPGRKAA